MQSHSEHDQYLWLEEILSPESLDWVRSQNALTEATLVGSERFKQIKEELIAASTRKDKLPAVAYCNGWFYNFWKDETNVKGLWRRVRENDYALATPPWETLLDLDLLAKTESTDWVWAGSTGLYPDFNRFLLLLSIGGSDAKVVREWDLESKSFVQGGFTVPLGKTQVSWITKDEILVSANFGPETVTAAGYPRQSKRWIRGTSLEETPVFFSGEPTDIYAQAVYNNEKGYEGFFAFRALGFHTKVFYRYVNDTWEQIQLPDSAEIQLIRDYIQISLKKDTTLLGKDYPAGSVLLGLQGDFFAGQNTLFPLYVPTPTSSFVGFTVTKNYALLTVQEHVISRTAYCKFGTWDWTPFTQVPGENITCVPKDAEQSDDILVYASGFLIPESLHIGSLSDLKFTLLKATPELFDANEYTVQQHFATSKDSTKVPYFLIHKKDLPYTAKNPTLLYGYGGFSVSMSPSYIATRGLTWLKHGGVFVIANIRGGGEYGPKWHQAAIRENKIKSYEDFASVAEDLFLRNITSPSNLGIEGGSNGGLLVGNMTVLYPKLFKAGICKVPLLDMFRYHTLLAGPSWIAEYGNPANPADLEFLRKISPYHNVTPGVKYPSLFISTSTKDDRVHPGHARKMVAKLKEHGNDVWYYENTTGGHAGASDHIMGAHIAGLQYSWLMQLLAP